MFGKLFGKEKFSLFELGRGYFFDYNNVVWEVVEIHNYKWGVDERTTEYKLNGYGKEAYLEVEKDDGEIICNFSVEVDKKDISPELTESDFEGEDILGELDYKNQSYILDSIEEGIYNNITNHESEKLTCFTFVDGEFFVAVEQWEDGSLEFFSGEEISPKSIKKIRKTK